MGRYENAFDDVEDLFDDLDELAIDTDALVEEAFGELYGDLFESDWDEAKRRSQPSEGDRQAAQRRTGELLRELTPATAPGSGRSGENTQALRTVATQLLQEANVLQRDNPTLAQAYRDQANQLRKRARTERKAGRQGPGARRAGGAARGGRRG
jgi:hypothetical protein